MVEAIRETDSTNGLGSGVVDDVKRARPPVSDTYRRVQEILLAQKERSLGQITAQAQQLMRELGVTFSLYREEAGKNRIIPFDPFPRILDAVEWEFLRRGLSQRLKLWNAFFRDIYGGQEVLKTGMMPFGVIYNDPNYQRAAVGVDVPQQTYVHTAAFDLARREDGSWVVIDDYVSTSTGIGYSIQSRSVLSQVCPELLEAAEIEPVQGFPTDLLEHLRQFSPGASAEPRVVLLSSGTYDAGYYEHSYLARQMGIPLVRGSDLIVLNTRVYLKTIGGLEPIDVIYRRVEDRWMDPLALSRGKQWGVPGLMSCARKGTVTIANAIGTGLGDNRAVSAYLPKLMRFYLNEQPLIPSINRLLCLDPDQCDEVLSNLGECWLASIDEHSNQEVWNTAKLPAAELGQLRQRILSHPGGFVAEPYLPLNLLPSCSSDGLESRHAGLRVFMLSGSCERSYPCALTRVSPEPGSRIISSGLGGGVKDTWILRAPSQPVPERPIRITSPQRRLRLGSRIAESLYWIGRYAERAENTTRIVKVLQLIQLENQIQQDAETWAPLWEALARVTGHPTNYFKRAQLPRKQTLAHYVLIDPKNPSSLLSCVGRCRANAQASRESIPPEVWIVINRLHQMLEEAAPTAQRNDAGQRELPSILQLQDNVLNQLDALTGCASKSMLRDDGWHFWTLGISVERAITTVLVMRQVFLRKEGQSFAETALMDALLRMLSCLYAYRSLFQSRPTGRNVAALLLQDLQLPRSVQYCVDRIGETLQTVFVESDREEHNPPVRECARLQSEVRFADLSSYFAENSRKARQFPRWLEQLSGKLGKLSVAISDHYLYHQAINILR